MKATPKLSLLYLLACFSFLLAACSGVKQTSGGGGGGGSATHTISATVSGLSGTGLILQDNGADNLTVSANGAVTFATAVANNGAYAVTVKIQPSTPSQTCVVVGGSGAAAANVMVQVNCSTGTFTVGGQVTGLTGSGLVLQNNGGDNLTVIQTGTFTFGTPVATGSLYSARFSNSPRILLKSALLPAEAAQSRRVLATSWSLARSERSQSVAPSPDWLARGSSCRITVATTSPSLRTAHLSLQA